jgi:hypothetical protein
MNLSNSWLTVLTVEGMVMLKTLQWCALITIVWLVGTLALENNRTSDRVKEVHITAEGDVVTLQKCGTDKSQCTIVTDRGEIMVGDWPILDELTLRRGDPIQQRITVKERSKDIAYCVRGKCYHHRTIESNTEGSTIDSSIAL